MATYPHVFQPEGVVSRTLSISKSAPMMGESVSESGVSQTPSTSKSGVSRTPSTSEPGGMMSQPIFKLKGKWAEEFFHNSNPIVLELGCGRGEYTVGLAKMCPDKNFIGVDIKGSRMWTGATESLRLGMKNVAFLRTRIEFIDNFFAPDEVSEIWLTFSDPQMKKPTKRLTSTYFMERYRRFLVDGGIVHVKTDSNFLFTYTDAVLQHNGISPILRTTDLYSDTYAQDPTLDVQRSIQTYYEQQWLDRGIPIKYISYALPHSTPLSEPEVEIELDNYRSYARNKRSSLTKAK